MASRIQIRGGTAAEWTIINPILAQRELGLETDTQQIKVGDGLTVWNNLVYYLRGVKGDIGPAGVAGAIGAQGPAGPVGAIGAQGGIGATGAEGLRGLTGLTGIQGIQGITGAIGIQGIQGIQGIKGDTGIVPIITASTLASVTAEGNVTPDAIEIGNVFTIRDTVTNTNFLNVSKYAGSTQFSSVGLNIFFQGAGVGGVLMKSGGALGVGKGVNAILSATFDVTGTGKFSGTVKGIAAITSDEFVIKSQLDNLLESPGFTGIPTVPTAIPTTNTTQIATTAFVQALNYDNVKVTGSQSITGPKYFSSIAGSYAIDVTASAAPGILVVASNSYSAYQAIVNNSAIGLNITHNSSNEAIKILVNSVGIGLNLYNFSSGKGIVVNAMTGSTGKLYIGNDINAVESFSVTRQGIISGNSFVKIDGTSSQFLKADGSVDSSVYLTSTGITPAALTRVDDTNITLTLGGTPNTALLQGVSLTLGWIGTLADARIASASTWNAKQAALSGTGFVVSTAGVISYDTNTYLTTTTASSTYLPLAGGTLTGHLLFSATNTYDIGSGSLDPRNIYLTTNLTWGTTSSFPMLKRNGAGINFRLADDSGYASINTGKLNIIDTISAGSGSLFGSALDITQTWNTLGGPIGIKLNITNTTSNATNARLIELQVGGSRKFAVNIFGTTQIESLLFNGNQSQITTSGFIIFSNSAGAKWTSGGDAGFGTDTGLERASAGVVKITNGSSGIGNLLGGKYYLEGTTSSFPMIKRNGTAIDFRLGDDSGYAAINTGLLGVKSNGALSQSALLVDGTWVISGGTSTTTKPHLLIEPSGTTSTGWATLGTAIGVNAASGFTGNLIDLQVAGVSKFQLRGGDGTITSTGEFRSGSMTLTNTGLRFGSLSGTMQLGANGVVGSASAEIDLANISAASNPGTIVFRTGTASIAQQIEVARFDALANFGIQSTSLTSNFQVNQSTAGQGTISIAAAGTTITGTSTQFTNTFKVGDTITSAGQTLTIVTVTNDTSMVTSAAVAAITAQAYTLVGGTRFSVKGNGNVGVGLSTPTYRLDVSGQSSATGHVQFYDQTATTGITAIKVVGGAGQGTQPLIEFYPSNGAARSGYITKDGAIFGTYTAPGNPLNASDVYLGRGMRRYTTTDNMSFYFGESLSIGTYGFQVAPISGTLPTDRNLVRFSRISDFSLPDFIIDGSGRVGLGVAGPTSYLHFKAGTATASTAPLKFTAGTLLTTPEAFAKEANAQGFYATNVALNRYAEGGAIKDFITTVDNSTTVETDLYTYTTKASTLAADGGKLLFKVAGTFNDMTATAQLQFYFGGTNIGNTGALTVSAIGGWNADVFIIRTSATTVRAVVTVNTPGASTALYTTQTDVTGLTLSATNIIKVTGTAGGSSGGTGDISAKLGTITWFGAANN